MDISIGDSKKQKYKNTGDINLHVGIYRQWFEHTRISNPSELQIYI